MPELPASGQEDTFYLVDRDIQTQTVSGDYFQINNPDNYGNATLSQLLGNAEQTTYSGKNKLNYLDAVPATNQTTTTFIDNGFRSVTTSTGYATKITLSVKASTTYTLSWTVKKVSGTMSPFVRAYEGTGTSTLIMYVASASDGSYHGSFTTASGVTQVNIWFYNGTPMQGTTDWTFIQLEESAAMTAYEPYVGGTASPNPDYPQPISTVTGEQTVKVEGKNLFDMDDFLTTAGATYTKDGGQYSITAWGNLISIRYPLQSVKTGNTYTISLDGVAQSTTSTRLQVYKNGSVIGTIYGGTDHQEHSYTFTADGSQYELNATYSSPFSSPVIFKNPQLELGSATTYEPYQGQSYEVNLGKNLFSVAFDSGGSTPASDTNAFTLTKPSTRAKMFNFPTTLAAGTYTISFNITSDTTSQSSVTGGIRCQLLSSSGAMISGTTAVAIGTGAKSKTWTVSEPVRAIYFYINGSEADDVSVAMTNVMLERGSTPTSYAPYFTPIELAKIGTYQDRIYKDSGKWYIEKQVGKVVLDGREAGWGIFSNNNAFYSGAYDTQKPSSMATAGAIMANYYTAESEVNIYNARVDYGIGISSQDRFLIRNKDIATVANLKTWLSTHPTTVYYPLATPTTTEITDETLLSQLNFIASLYEGVNNISIVGTGAQGTITIDYQTFERYNKHFVYIWNDDIDDWQIIVQ